MQQSPIRFISTGHTIGALTASLVVTVAPLALYWHSQQFHGLVFVSFLISYTITQRCCPCFAASVCVTVAGFSEV